MATENESANGTLVPVASRDQDGSESDSCVNSRKRTETIISEDGEIDVVCVSIETEGDVIEPTEGGWGWVILVGSILLRIVSGGIMRSNGLFFIQFQERFGGSASETAWVTSLSATIRLFLGPVVSIMCNRFSARQLSFCGTVFFVASLIISGFAPNTVFLYFSYGVLGGIGRAFFLTPLPILLGEYFSKRRSMAFGVSSSGFGIGGFALTPLIEVFFQMYGFTGTFVLLGGIACHLFVVAALFRPPKTVSKRSKRNKNSDNTKDTAEPLLPKARDVTTEADATNDSNGNNDNSGNNGNIGNNDNHDNSGINGNNDNSGITDTNDQDTANNQTDSKKDVQNGRLSRRRSTFQQKLESVKSAFKEDEASGKKPLIAFSVLKDVRFLTMCIATFLFSLPTMSLFIPPLAKSHGLSAMECAYLLSITSGCDTVSRIVAGFLLDMKALRQLRPIIYNVATFFQIIPCFVFPFMRTFASFAVVCSLHGFVMGVKMSQRNVVLVDILGVDKLASSFAILLTVQGTGTLIGPPVSGFLRDVSGSFDGAFFFAGSAITIGACILCYGNIRKHKNDIKKKKIGKGKTETESEREDERNGTTIHVKDENV